jgi:restriction system protein
MYDGWRRFGCHQPMSIPDNQTIMVPLLRFASDGNEHRVFEAVEHLAGTLNLSAEGR